MHAPIPPMSNQSVHFAKGYRAEQVQTAGQLRHRASRPLIDRVRTAAAIISGRLQIQPGHAGQRPSARSAH